MAIPVDGRDCDEAIDGYANRTLWPALHGLTANIEQRETWWSRFQQMSEATAKLIADQAEPSTPVWIHDHHHLGVGRHLRDLRPDLPIGLSCHTPIDQASIAELHHADDLIRDLAAHHLIGTQTSGDAAALSALFDAAGCDHQPVVLPIPAGVDVTRWNRYRHDADVGLIAHRIAGGSGVLAVGVDLVDYTKGLTHKLLAIEMLLDTGAIDADDFRLIQVAVPCRRNLEFYRFLESEIEALAHRVNLRFPRSDGRPVIELITDHQSPEQLAGLMRASDLAIVTPPRDGMNLVALEYSIVNADRTTDVILSRGAGAATYIGRWCDLVDGGDVLDIAAALRDIVSRSDRRPRRNPAARARAARELSSLRWRREFLGELADAAV